MAACYSSYRKKEVGEKAKILLDAKCCDRAECDDLAKDLVNLQHECDDLYHPYYSEEDDGPMGYIPGTICAELRDKKNAILEDLHEIKCKIRSSEPENVFNFPTKGGKRTRYRKRKTKTHRKKSRKNRRPTRRSNK